MSFDAHLAYSIAHETDRDTARYFEGRGAEQRQFRHAIDNAQHYKAAQFRIFQGAPGCGKTSLANHLAEKHAHQSLFVQLDHNSIESLDAVMQDAIRKAHALTSPVAKLGLKILEVALEKRTTKSLAEATVGAYGRFISERKTITLWLDEAQAMSPAGLHTLLRLHTKGLGDAEPIPCVVILTGLQHTEDHVSSHPGLSRLAGDTTIQMGRLSDAECAESTKAMLDALRPKEAPAEARQHLAELSSKWSRGWPQHLHGAQKAICESVLRADGYLTLMNYDQVEQRCDALRAEYYGKRLRLVPVPGNDPALKRKIVAQLGSTELPPTGVDLWEMCADVINGHWDGRLPDDNGKTTATALIQKGIVEPTGTRWALSIPSMSTWAEQELDGKTSPK